MSVEDDVRDDAPGVHFYTKLAVSLESLNQQMAKANDREQRRLAGLPINYPLQKLSAPAGVTDLQDFGGPQPGRLWIVRQLTGFASPVVTGATTTVPASPTVSPAAGSEILFAVPAGHTYQLGSILFDLTTSATVANRQVTLVIDDGFNNLWQILLPVTQAAGLTYRYVFGGSTNDAAVRTLGATNEVLSELPVGLVIGPGFGSATYRIRTVTANLQAGDQYSNFRVMAQDTANTVGAAVVSWYIGQIMPGDAPGQLPITMKRWEFSTLPGEQNFTSNVLTLRNGEHLIAGLTNVQPNSRISLNAVVNDQPAWAARFGVVEEN